MTTAIMIRQRRLLLLATSFLMCQVANVSANIYAAQQPQYSPQYGQGYADPSQQYQPTFTYSQQPDPQIQVQQAQTQPQQFHSYSSQPGVQYGQDTSFFPNQAALTAAATSFAASAAQQYAQTYQQGAQGVQASGTQSVPQIDSANLAKYSQYLDILQKAYGIQLPGELTMQPNAQGAGIQTQGATGVQGVQGVQGGYSTQQQILPQQQTYVQQPQPQPQVQPQVQTQPQSFSGYPQQPQVTPQTQAEITYQQQLAAYQQQQQQIAQQQQQQQLAAQQEQQRQQQQQQQLAQQQAAAAAAAEQQRQQQAQAELARQQIAQQQQQQQQNPYNNQYGAQTNQGQGQYPGGMQPNPYVQGQGQGVQGVQAPMNFLPAPQAPVQAPQPQAPYIPPTVPPTQPPSYKNNYQTAALGQYGVKPQVYTYPGPSQVQKPTHSTSFGNENSVIEEDMNNHQGSVISNQQIVPPRPVQPVQTVQPPMVVATVTRAPPPMQPTSSVVTKSQPQPRPVMTTRAPTPATTRRPPPPSTKAATSRPTTSGTTSSATSAVTPSPSQSLTQQIRKLPAVLYIDSRNENTKKTETLLRETYGLPLVTFYVDKIEKPAAIERQLQQLTAHKGLPYLFICGTFIGSDSHIENYHSNGQIPQLVEYVCGDDKKKKKTKKTTSS